MPSAIQVYYVLTVAAQGFRWLLLQKVPRSPDAPNGFSRLPWRQNSDVIVEDTSLLKAVMPEYAGTPMERTLNRFRKSPTFTAVVLEYTRAEVDIGVMNAIKERAGEAWPDRSFHWMELSEVQAECECDTDRLSLSTLDVLNYCKPRIELFAPPGRDAEEVLKSMSRGC